MLQLVNLLLIFVVQVGIDIARIDQAINFANEEAEFNNRILQANRESRIAQTERDIAAIELQRRGQDLQAEAAVGIMPTQLEYAPFPEITPERVFLPSRKVKFRDLLGPQAPIPSGQPSTADIIQQGLGVVTAGANVYEAFKVPTPQNLNVFGGDGATRLLNNNIYNPATTNPNQFLASFNNPTQFLPTP